MNVREPYCDRLLPGVSEEQSCLREGVMNKAKELDVEDAQRNEEARELKAEVLRKRPWPTGEVKIPIEVGLGGTRL